MSPGTSPSSGPSALLTRVARTLERRALLTDGDRVAVAVSGGADSVALTLVLVALQTQAAWNVVGLVHVNHGLRAAESDGDEAFCRALADRLRLPIDVSRVDVRAAARERARSLEAAAREARYAEFDRAAAALGATRLATGHTRDDQAETVLLRLFRGSSARGVAGIRPRRGMYVRPLLDCGRQEIRAFLEAGGQPHREDSSNRDLTISRNRLRHTLMPVIERDWPRVVRALARFADLAGDDEDFLTATAHQVMPAVTLATRDGVQLDVRGLRELPAALARRVVRGAVEAAGGTTNLGDVEAVRRLAGSDKPRGGLDLEGVRVERLGHGLRIESRAHAEDASAFEHTLPVPGQLDIPETGWSILASVSGGEAAPRSVRDALEQGPHVVALGGMEGRLPLLVRSRRPGDRLRPFGSSGTRKVQDLLVDRKIPRRDRDRLPIVTDIAGAIVWVAGLAMAEDCRVTRPEAGVVILELKKGNL